MQAQGEFEKNYNYMYGPFNSFSEEPAGSATPHFTTGMGTFLTAVVQGWAGVRYIPTADACHSALIVTPQLPQDSTTNLTLAGIHYQQSALVLTILPEHARLTVVQGSALACTTSVKDERAMDAHLLEIGSQPVAIPLGSTARCSCV